ncbi:MAG: hypothetical protein CM1200mP1_07960 [Candidatus Neomarinimicrobiota bacterium]|nr:MAG: hypothetical protein CM1200mP1_07960 [Candidatus Neomarinimicrobiota bacterium]
MRKSSFEMVIYNGDSGKIYQKTLKDIEAEGLYKQERIITHLKEFKFQQIKGMKYSTSVLTIIWD